MAGNSSGGRGKQDVVVARKKRLDGSKLEDDPQHDAQDDDNDDKKGNASLCRIIWLRVFHIICIIVVYGCLIFIATLLCMKLFLHQQYTPPSTPVARNVPLERVNWQQQQQQHPHPQRPKTKGKANTSQQEEEGGVSAFKDSNPKIHDILMASKTLIDLEIDHSKLRKSAPDSYDGIYGLFCTVDFQLHKNDPSSVPMFRYLVGESPGCSRRDLVKVPLREIAEQSRQLDQKIAAQQSTSSLVPKALNLTAVVFHESRCGSTLVANTLIGANPKEHRVYSESTPPLVALRLCYGGKGGRRSECSEEQGIQILQDVMYMMGRSQDPNERRVFFKIQSVGTRYILRFRKAFPTTPWLFVYRDPVQVMMSHLKNGIKRANCLREYSHPPLLTARLAKSKGYDAPGDMDPEFYCAAHLAGLTESALIHLQSANSNSSSNNRRRRQYGAAIQYDDLPQVMYEKVFPNHLDIPMRSADIRRIQTVAGHYSKGMGNRKREWTSEGDSEQKEREATNKMREAAKVFLKSSFDQLNAIRL